MSRSLALFTTLAILASLPAAPVPFRLIDATGDWPQFRGPKRDNLSPDKGLLKAWTDGGPKLLWRADGLGVGFSSFSVVEGRVLTMGDKEGSTFIIALDRATGRQLWAAKAGKASTGSHAGARCTPSVSGSRVFALTQPGELVCLDLRTGAEKWRRDLVKDYQGRPSSWGYCESPLIDGDRVIVTPGGAKATLAALEATTGKEIWLCPAGLAAGCASAVPCTVGGVKHYVQFTAGGLVGVSAKDGALLWKYDKVANTTASAATPVVLPGHVFTTAGFGKGGALLSLTGAAGKVAATESYLKADLQNKYGGVTAMGDQIYGDTDSSGRPFCADWKTGTIRWTRAVGSSRGAGSVSMASADGHLYMLYENGHVALVPANTKAYSEAGSFQLPGAGKECRVAPVVIGGRMYLRDKGSAWCHDVRAR